jgi:Uma2 family endonuclease
MNAPLFPPTIAGPALPTAVIPEEPVVPLTLEAYHSLVQSGKLASGDPIEFLEGWLVPKMTKGPRHAAVKRRLLRMLLALVQSPYFVDAQEAMSATDSEPEPDIYVVRGPEQLFHQRHPGPGEVEVVMEISDATLHRDRGLKKRVYARAAVPTYWIINLVDDCVELFTQPSGPTDAPLFAARETFLPGQAVPLVVGGVELGRLAVSEILFGAPEKAD